MSSKKKLVLLVLALVIVALSVCACGGEVNCGAGFHCCQWGTDKDGRSICTRCCADPDHGNSKGCSVGLTGCAADLLSGN